MPDVDMTRVAELLDKEDIRAVVIKCSRGMDRHDDDLVAASYHPGGADDHGEFVGTVEQFIPYANDRHDSWRKHQHYIVNQTVDLDGDTAHVESYYFAVFQRRDNNSTDFSVGRYLDRMERRNGEWRIANRLTILDWVGEFPGPDEGTESPVIDQFIHGTWDKSDASYDRPLVPKRPPRLLWKASAGQ